VLIHLESSELGLLGTIAFEVDDDVVYYGISLVSDSEPEDRVDRAGGRNKAVGRLRSAVENHHIVDWKAQVSKGQSRFVNYKAAIVKSCGFCKLGNMTYNMFKKNLISLMFEFEIGVLDAC